MHSLGGRSFDHRAVLAESGRTLPPLLTQTVFGLYAACNPHLRPLRVPSRRKGGIEHVAAVVVNDRVTLLGIRDWIAMTNGSKASSRSMLVAYGNLDIGANFVNLRALCNDVPSAVIARNPSPVLFCMEGRHETAVQSLVAQ